MVRKANAALSSPIRQMRKLPGTKSSRSAISGSGERRSFPVCYVRRSPERLLFSMLQCHIVCSSCMSECASIAYSSRPMFVGNIGSDVTCKGNVGKSGRKNSFAKSMLK